MSGMSTAETLITIFFPLINSHLSYGISIYGATSKGNLVIIVIQQQEALRRIFHIKERDTVQPYFSKIQYRNFNSLDLNILETVSYV